MTSKEPVELGEHRRRRIEAAEQLNRQENRDDGVRVVASLADGLTVLRDSLYHRVHQDVQRTMGMDSMLMPVSEEKSEKLGKVEIEIFQIAVSADIAREFVYVQAEDDWYLQWLARFRLGRAQGDAKVRQRVAHYLSKSSDGRRLAFSNVLAAALPESRRAPLVLFQLIPLAVQIVTCLAFGDQPAASDARSRQRDYLPSINDCRSCGGGVLENGERCRECGNPLWKFRWLLAAD